MFVSALPSNSHDCSTRTVTNGTSSPLNKARSTCFGFKFLITFWLLSSCQAHSFEDDSPMQDIELLQDPLILTQWHRVSASSRFDLILSTKSLDNSSSQEDIYKFELEPNEIHQPSSFDRLLVNGQTESVAIDSSSRPLVYKGRSLKRIARGKSTSQDRQELVIQNNDTGDKQQLVPWEYLPVGWVRIVISRDGPKPIFQGAWQSDDGIYHAKIDTDDINEPRIIIKKESAKLLDEGFEKKQDVMMNDETLNNAPLVPRLLHRRDIFGHFIGPGLDLYSSIGSTQGCPDMRRIALIGIAVDCTTAASFPDDNAIRDYVISNINLASALFEKSFNISLGLKSLVISDKACPSRANDAAPWNSDCTSDGKYGIADHLSSFSRWRSTRGDDGIAIWQLITNCRSGPAVGLAWLGTLCMHELREQESAFISGTSVIAKTSKQWKVMAHEMAHNFGAVHDCTSPACLKNLNRESQCCPYSKSTCAANEVFIMNPSTSELADEFSPCTIGNVCNGLKARTVDSTCLVSNTGMQLVTDSICGNGIVEEGEECDCGGEEGCKGNKCCDAKTCKFTSGSICDESTMSCCKDCQFAPASTVCRPSAGICDLEEQCTGLSAECPEDRVAEDGMECGEDGKKCASGICTSRNDQCSKLIQMAFNATGGSACADRGCRMSCINPQVNKDMCLNFDQVVLDGSPCGNDESGKCLHGMCIGETRPGMNGLLHDIESWIHSHRGIFIATMSAGGLLILTAIGLSIYRCAVRRRSASATTDGQKPPQDGSGISWFTTTTPPSSNNTPTSQSTVVAPSSSSLPNYNTPSFRAVPYNNSIYGVPHAPNI